MKEALFPIGHKFACIYDAFLDWNVSTKKCNFQNIFEVWDFILAPPKFSSYSTFSISAKLQTTNHKLQTTNYKLQTTNYDLQNYKLQIPAPLRVSSSNTISDEELVTYNVKELNRVLKSKGDLNINYAYLTNVWKGQNIFMIDHHQ